MNDTVAYENDGTGALLDQAEIRRLLIRGGGGCFEVEWDADAKVTPTGSVVFFAQYLRTGGLLERFCGSSPLEYKSNNAPDARDVMGTLLLSILNGQTRYAHINALRSDRVGAEVLGLGKVVSEDSVRRALGRGTEEAWDTWLAGLERMVVEPLLAEAYVLDIDSTVKPLYGHQEGAELGYNPKKPGRPSHNYHTYFIGALRLVLGADVQPGKEHSGGCGMPGLWKLIDSLPSECRPRLIRGDVGYGNEKVMAQAEARGQPYLFKLRRSPKVKSRFRELTAPGRVWTDAGDGWQASESRLKLAGWTAGRRCVFLRRPARAEPPRPSGPEFGFVSEVTDARTWDYAVLVTNNRTLDAVALSRLYRDRADCENVKNAREERRVAVSWGATRNRKFTARLRLEAIDRSGLFGDVVQAIAAGEGVVTGIKAGVVGGNMARMRLELRVRDLEHLYHIVARLNAVKGMIQVTRG